MTEKEEEMYLVAEILTKRFSRWTFQEELAMVRKCSIVLYCYTATDTSLLSTAIVS